MKIIHLISGGDSGGAKTHVLSLLSSMPGHAEVQLVCFMDGPFAEEARALGIPTEIFADKNPFAVCRRLKRYIRNGGFKLIHCHGSRANLIGAMLRRELKLPVVTTVHSDYRLDYLGRPLHRLTYGSINTVALRKLDYRIGVSDAMVDLLIQRGFSPQRLFPIYNGLDFHRQVPLCDRQTFYRELGFSADECSVVVGIAARLNPVKDIATLIRGFALASGDCPDLRLLIAGDGEEREMLGHLAEELGMAEKVCFAGWQSDMDRFYQAIDINTLTSLSETFPYALTEGARMRLPTVSTRVGGVPYLIDPGVNGFLFEPGDAEALAAHLRTLYRDPALRQTMGQKLFEKGARQFSVESTRDRQLEIYRTILRRQTRDKHERDGVVVCGAYGRGNAGDDAILEAILLELKELDPDLPITVLSRDPDATRLRYRVDSVYTFAIPRFLSILKKTKLYINGGGSLIQDVTSSRSLWFYLFTLWAAKQRHNQVLMYGCGIGPVRREFNRKQSGRILDSCVDRITLREPHSAAELESLEVKQPQVAISADPTLVLPPAPTYQVDSLMLREGLEPGEEYIAFALRKWPGFEERAHIFGQAADYAYETYGLTPVFIPIEKRIDLEAAQKAAAHMKAPHIIVRDAGEAGTAIGLFSRMQLVVSMRLHALVFAAGQGIPLVGVVYDHKVSSFLQYIGQDLYMDLAQLELSQLKACIDQAADRRGQKAELAEAVSRLREIESKNSLAARELLGS